MQLYCCCPGASAKPPATTRTRSQPLVLRISTLAFVTQRLQETSLVLPSQHLRRSRVSRGCGPSRHGPNNSLSVRVVRKVVNKGPIYFQAVNNKLPQVRQAGIAGTEIVNGYFYPVGFQNTHFLYDLIHRVSSSGRRVAASSALRNSFVAARRLTGCWRRRRPRVPRSHQPTTDPGASTPATSVTLMATYGRSSGTRIELHRSGSATGTSRRL